MESSASYITAGESCSFAISEGKVYAWGKNTNGQLGPKLNVVDATPRVLKVCNKFFVKTLSCPFGHVVALTKDKNVITWSNDIRLRGRGENSKVFADAIELQMSDLQDDMGEMDVGYVDCAAGRFHSIAVDMKGRMKVWGLTSESHHRTIAAQAPDFEENVIWKPKSIDLFNVLISNNDENFKKLAFGEGTMSLTRIEKIAVHCFHSIAVSEDQRVYTWGVKKANRCLRLAHCTSQWI